MPILSQEQIAFIGAIGSIATPFLLSILAGFGWLIQRRLEKSQIIEKEIKERQQKREDFLREDRIKLYNEILEPFVIIFTKEEGFLHDKNYRNKTKDQIAQEKIMSLSYKQAAFKFALYADDNVIRAYNEVMQFFYASSQNQDNNKSDREKTYKLLNIFSSFLLEIRKSIGNENTKLENLEMIEWFISDIRQIKNEFKNN
jgi:hypothetical protein